MNKTKQRWTLLGTIISVLLTATAAAAPIRLPVNGKTPVGFSRTDNGAIYLNAGYRQFGGAVIPFPAELTSGRVVFRLTLTGMPQDSAPVAFYLVDRNHRQRPLSQPAAPAGGTSQTLTLSAEITAPAIGLMVKKMKDVRLPGAAVSAMEMEYFPEVPSPREPWRMGRTFAFSPAVLPFESGVCLHRENHAGIAVPAGTGKYGWSRIPLARELPSGNYRFAGTLFADRDGMAPMALYADCGGKQVDILKQTGMKQAGTRTVGGSFFASAPFRSVIMKKMEASAAPSVALGDFQLTMDRERRLAGALDVFRYPIPFGVESQPLLREMRESARKGGGAPRQITPRAEAWLDCASLAMNAIAKFESLRRSAKAWVSTGNELDWKTAEACRTRMLNALQTERTSEAEQAALAFLDRLTILHRTLNSLAGGEVLPEYGTDLWGWNKTFETIIGDDAAEFEEPTPFRVRLANNAIFRFRSATDGERGTFRNSWTANRYEWSDIAYCFSALTPVILIEAKRGAVRLEFSGDCPSAEELDGALLLTWPQSNVRLLIFGRSPMPGWHLRDRKLQISFPGPTRAGVLRLSAGDKAQATLRQYRDQLENLPVEAAFRQRGNTVTLRYFTIDGKIAPTAPVPPMVSLSQHSPFPVRLNPVSESGMLEYRLPSERPVRREPGINLFDKENPDPALFAELAASGCRVLRLTLGCSTRWDAAAPEKMRGMLIRTLELARNHGLKVGLDNHAWLPDSKKPGPFDSPAYQKEFLNRWKQILAWVAPYRGTIAWYDLMNEPHLFREKETVAPYWRLVAATLPELRRLDPETPFLVEVTNMANPVGAKDWQRQTDGNVIVGFHDYWPHMLTHQKVQDNGSPGMNDVHYPGFLPMISWQAPSWRTDDVHWAYWDQWKCFAVNRDLIRLLVAAGLPGDCGEFGIVGYGSGAGHSGRIWLDDSFARMRRLGVSATIWGIHGGYTWNQPFWKDAILRQWRAAPKVR